MKKQQTNQLAKAIHEGLEFRRAKELTAAQAAGAELNSQLIEAVLDDDEDLVEDLLKAGASPNTMLHTGENRDPDRALPDRLRAMLNADTDPLLIEAVRNSTTEIVEMLLKAGADPNTNDGHRTALMWAADSGDDDVVPMLLERGSDMEYRDFDGHTALMLAANNNHGNVVKILLEAGADTSRRNRSGDNAEDLALEVLKYPGIDEEMRDQGLLEWFPDAHTLLVAHRERQMLQQAAGIDGAAQEPPRPKRKM